MWRRVLQGSEWNKKKGNHGRWFLPITLYTHTAKAGGGDDDDDV